jgi:hypothetical protein
MVRFTSTNPTTQEPARPTARRGLPPSQGWLDSGRGLCPCSYIGKLEGEAFS